MTRITFLLMLALVMAGACLYAPLLAQSSKPPRGDDAADLPPPQKVAVTVQRIPVFVQAGRTYVFQPAGGEEFTGKIVSVDATGWVQLQLRAGGDVGPVAEWFNLDNMLSIKARP
jgi:hypothetical protein